MKLIPALLLCLCGPVHADMPLPRSPVTINHKEYIPLTSVRQFYQFDQETINGNQVRLQNQTATVDLTIGAQAARINGVRFFLSDPVATRHQTPHLSKLDLTRLIDPVLRPHQIKKAKSFDTVILDPGHGGADRGSAGLEAKHTLALAQLTRKTLGKKGYKVMMTRSGNERLPLSSRVAIINRLDNAIVISLHFNSGRKEVSGFETYVISARQPHPAGQASVALAAAVHTRSLMDLNHAQSGHHFKIKDRGIRHARFRLLRDSKHPAILIEAGFLTHKEEATLITTEAYQQTLAAAIAQGIADYNTAISKKEREDRGSP